MATATTLPIWKQTIADVRALSGVPRELWLVFAVKFLESVAYFSVLNLLVIYLEHDLHYDDVRGGFLFAFWATAISVMTFFAGFVADSLTIRRALILSVACCVVGRVLLMFSTTRPVAAVALGVMAWGVASMLPTMTAAVRRYTSSSSVSFAFSLFYVMMNVGALVAPLLIGALRKLFEHGTTISLPLLGPTAFSSSRLVFAVGAMATALAVGLVLAMRPDHEVPAAPGGEPPSPVVARGTPWSIARGVLGESTFWRFILFLSLLVLVKLVFQHAHQTWPKYTLRMFGESFPFGFYWAINPAIIILLTPFVSSATRHRSAFQCIVWGAFLTALSVFFMAVSTSVAASVAFIVVLSFGEALWSPRLYEYTATVAPRGREASYMGLSSVPMFVAKPLVGGMSGLLLATWCPAVGARQPQLMWLVIGLSTLIGPILMVALRKVIEAKPEPVAVAAGAYRETELTPP